MGMNKTTMATSVVTAVLSTPIDSGTLADFLTADQRAQMQENWELICDAIINHITQNAVVTVQMQSHTHSGVTSGPSSSGPPVPTNETGTVA